MISTPPVPIDPPPGTPADPSPAMDAAAESAPESAPESNAPAEVAPEASGPAAEGAQAPLACEARLKALFPGLFAGPVKPIKLHVQADIQARAPGAFKKAELGAFFRRWTASRAYLHALAQSSQRFDLDGQPAGEVSAEHRQVATAELQRRRQLMDQRRHEEQAQWRERARLLREWDTTTLTRANFCALKGVPEGALDALLARAREEARAAGPQDAGRPPGRGGREGGGRREGGGGREGEGRPARPRPPGADRRPPGPRR